jgi:hypothetical protein
LIKGGEVRVETDQLGKEIAAKVVTGGDWMQATTGPARLVIFSRDQTQGGEVNWTLGEHCSSFGFTDVAALWHAE